MKSATILLALFIVLTIVFASISTYDYVQSGNQRSGDTTTASSGQTLTTTTATSTCTNSGTIQYSTTTYYDAPACCSVPVNGTIQCTTSSTTISTLTTTTTITTRLLPNQGLIQIVVGGTAFTYTQWNSSTPNTFTISNVKFALWTNSTVTYSGGSCYGAFGGYGGYVITFPDGSTDKMSSCTFGPNPPTTIRLTSHVNPQAGILIVPSTGAVYFLVSA